MKTKIRENSNYRKVSPTTGASPVNTKAGLKLPSDGVKGGVAGKGTSNERYISVKPNGAAKAITPGNAPADQKNTTLGRSYIKTKPKK